MSYAVPSARPFPRLRAVLRPALALSREAPLWVGAARAGQGRGPRVVFLPATRPEGAALLRIFAPARALKAKGWGVHVLPPTLGLPQRRRLLGALRPDVVVMQGARHALNRPALYPGQRIVYDMDDADFHLPHLAAPVIEAMGQVAVVMAGGRYIADWAQRQGAARTKVIWTGSPVSSRHRPPQTGRPPVVAWAQTRPMSYGREAALVAHVTAQMASARPGLTLRLFDRRAGDDPAFPKLFEAPGLRVEWVPSLPYSDYLRRFDDVALSFAPLCPETPFSRGKSFGKVLAALDRKVPVIGSDACEHGAFFTPASGIITNDRARWISAGVSLLDDAVRRQSMADKAHSDFLSSLTTSVAAERLADVLRDVIPDDARRPVG